MENENFLKCAENIYFEEVYLPLTTIGDKAPIGYFQRFEGILDEVLKSLESEGYQNKVLWNKCVDKLKQNSSEKQQTRTRLLRDLYKQITPFRARELNWTLSNNQTFLEYLEGKNLILLLGSTGKKRKKFFFEF